MKRIIIDIYDKSNGSLDGLIEMKSEEYGFIHSSDKTGRGMQCKHKEGTNEYAKLFFRLDRVADLIRKIELSENRTGGLTMKCKNCEHFSFAKCIEGKCLGGCDIDPKNRTVNLEDECILESEDWG